MEPEESISKLLRLKRYEKPRPDYFEDFLAEFQLRQRAEVIHRPFWNIAWDRFSSLFAPIPVPRLVTASSFAAAVIAAGVTLNWSGNEAGSTPATWNLSSPAQTRLGSTQSAFPPTKKRVSSVQYVLPTRPTGYASAHSF
jgi:hypothetical protein